MSRFQEYDGDGEFNPWNGWFGRAMSGRATNAALHEFLAHLDAMPVKRIAYEKFYDPETGDHCTVGEFAKMRGMAREKIEDYAKQSVEQVHNYGREGGDDDYQSGPTVQAGQEVGLPMTIAYALGAHNDQLDFRYVDAEGPMQPWDWRNLPRARIQ